MKWLRRILIVIFAALLLFSAYKVYDYARATRAGKAAVETLSQKAVTQRPPQKSPKPPPITVDFQILQEKCPDIVAWLYCPDTAINYPVVQGEDNSYYLRRLTDGSYNYGGTLFLDYRCAGDFTGRSHIIYGHNMKNGTMFSILPKYSSQDFYEAHPAWYLLTPEKNYRVDLAAGFTTPDDSAFYTLPQSQAEQAALLVTALEKSDFSGKTAPDGGGGLVLFSTCSYQYDTARYVLLGTLQEIAGP